ncbi:MAG: hypothetical protein ACJ74O_05250 [Frankiaceae bacterium]
MSWTDWAISLGLILLVLRQIRGKKLTPGSLLWPVALVVWAGFEYLGGFPVHSSDRIFTGSLAAIGLALGLGCGALTRVYHDGEQVIGRATIAAAVLWIVGMASRLTFGIVALNGGAEAIGRLSERLDLHSESTWPTALILMALCEVLSRTALLLGKYRAAARGATKLAPSSSPTSRPEPPRPTTTALRPRQVDGFRAGEQEAHQPRAETMLGPSAQRSRGLSRASGGPADDGGMANLSAR